MANGRNISWSGYVSQRWVMAVMGMMGVMIAYVMRACLGITLTQMVRPVVMVDESVRSIRHEYCPMPHSSSNGNTKSNRTDITEDKYQNRFDWDEKTQGEILSSFYYGYILTHLPSGVLSQRFGGKHTMGLGILSTAVFTLMTPYVSYMGTRPLTILRFIEGLGEGTMFPALCTLLAQWAPPEEKGKLSTLVFAGVQIGNIFSNFLSGLIIQYIPGGWPNVFYIFGITSLIWFVLWCMFVYDDPSSHPFISKVERDYLKESIGSLERQKDLAPTPWITILTSWPVWALIIVEAGHDWGAYTIITDLPKYMNDVLHFSISENGLLSSFPYIAQWVTSILVSILADWLITKRIMSVTAVRKSFAVIGNVGPGIGVICASFVGCNKMLATLCFTLGLALMGFCYPSIRVNSLDLSHNYAPTIMALVNGIGCLSGMATPYIVGILTPNRTVLEWRLVFWIMMAVMTASSVVYGIYGSGELQPWDNLQQHCLKENEKSKRELPMNERLSIIYSKSIDD
ncbi:putative inorganic phosphate cotransporter isoform X1 [Metopolophium dirhodum]|uniref:putative inorganic phosphate cotransporter isoform X1 n=1 Tax=Metopolophium dirhodum TaxID=44670 RepID=UPI00299033CB|nr:putative inorganic phosphate cotransporter isoform X1 [Metopolophium dirhodum]XP_060861730.1 putative inorganic phosphate cotransporter isoform X1 [Metopolophium dirhodum]XP_060861731.1 putative inorganic phosphate cotransporter isoform X1 [Metopolophium dirhodum]